MRQRARDGYSKERYLTVAARVLSRSSIVSTSHAFIFRRYPHEAPSSVIQFSHFFGCNLPETISSRSKGLQSQYLKQGDVCRKWEQFITPCFIPCVRPTSNNKAVCPNSSLHRGHRVYRITEQFHLKILIPSIFFFVIIKIFLVVCSRCVIRDTTKWSDSSLVNFHYGL